MELPKAHTPLKEAFTPAGPVSSCTSTPSGLDARWSELAYCRAEVCLLLGPDIADRLADPYSDIVGETSDELAVYDLMSVLNTRRYAPESLDAYRDQGHAPNYQLSLAHLDQQLQRALRRLDR